MYLNNCIVVSIWYDPWKWNAALLFTLFGGINLWLLIVSVHLAGTWEISIKIKPQQRIWIYLMRVIRWTLEDTSWFLSSRETDRLNCVSLAVVMCRLDSVQQKHLSVSWRGLHLSGCIPISALPRSPSLSVFYLVYLNDPTIKGTDASRISY